MPKYARRRVTLLSEQGLSCTSLRPALKTAFRGAVIREISADGLLDLDQRDIALFLPGITGEVSPYHTLFTPTARAALDTYLRSGGAVFAQCAAAYLMARQIIYDPPWLETPKMKSGLNYFNAVAKGPPEGLGRPSGDERYSDCEVAPITVIRPDGSEFETGIAFGNGPALFPEEDDPNLNVIARFTNVPGQPISIADQAVGDGLLTFCGVLPEIGTAQFMQGQKWAKLHALNDALKPHEEGRREVWEILTRRIKEHAITRGRAIACTDYNRILGPMA